MTGKLNSDSCCIISDCKQVYLLRRACDSAAPPPFITPVHTFLVESKQSAETCDQLDEVFHHSQVMSLFGSSPDDSSLSKPVNGRQQSKGLFNDDSRPQSNGGNSLFADDAATDSPWSMPTPKKAARSELIKNLIPATEAPESYVDAFDAILESGDGIHGKISSSGVTKLLQNSNLSSAGQTRLLNIVASDGNISAGLDRGSFNVLMAMIGLAQEGEEVTLDGVDERKKSA